MENIEKLKNVEKTMQELGNLTAMLPDAAEKAHYLVDEVCLELRDTDGDKYELVAMYDILTVKISIVDDYACKVSEMSRRVSELFDALPYYDIINLRHLTDTKGAD